MGYMKTHDKKRTIFQVLCKEHDFISLPVLLSKLGSDIKERSLWRWLNEMVQEGIVEKIGQKRTTQYRVVKKQNNWQYNIQNVSAIEYVQKPLYERKPIPYGKQWVDLYQPNSTFYISEEI